MYLFCSVFGFDLFMYFAIGMIMPFLCLINANILSISLLYFKSVSYLMHDIHINTAPSEIVNFFQKTSSIHAYNTRSSFKNNMYIKKI